MVATMGITIVCAMIAGLIVKWWLDHADHDLEITWAEFAIGSLIAVVIVVPLVGWIGWKVSVNSLVSYNEYWNGWETAAIADPIRCTRDGPCIHEYDCDPYWVTVSYSCNCDGRGNCDTCYREEVRYHDCPYVDVETTYAIQTTIGDYVIDEYRFPNDPQEHRWRNHKSIPLSVIERAGVGEPPFWSRAKARIDAGSPGPVCKRKAYENYVLASERTILKQYSGDVKAFGDAGLLPPLASDVHDFYLADKVYFVGWTPTDAGSWQSALRYLNAALGSELRGDLHLVVVRDARVAANPDAYVNALRAHWHDTERYGRDAFAKNAIAVVIGTNDDERVRWARAFTGMPIGNEAMTTAVRAELAGLPLEPVVLLGSVRGYFRGATAQPPVGSEIKGGIIFGILWGDKDPKTEFRRVSMAAKDADDIGSGYLYLRNEIRPTTGQLIGIGVIVFILCGGLWFAAAMIGERVRSRGHAVSQTRRRI